MRRRKTGREHLVSVNPEPMEAAARWMAEQLIKVEIDPRVGGAYAFVDRRDGDDVAHVGEYLEIDRPRRVVFTFGVPKYSPLVTTVTIDIVPLEDGCDLTLTNEGVLPEYDQPGISGWTRILEGLAASV